MTIERPNPSHEVVAAWVDHGLASRLKAQAEIERRSVSSLVRNVLEDFAESGEDRRRAGFAPFPRFDAGLYGGDPLKPEPLMDPAIKLRAAGWRMVSVPLPAGPQSDDDDGIRWRDPGGIRVFTEAQALKRLGKEK